MNMFKIRHWLGRYSILALVATSIRAEAALKTLPGHVPAVVAHLAAIGRLPATNHLDLAIGVPIRNDGALTAFLADLYNPASPNFRHYLTPAEFTARFGPSEADYQSAVEFAQSNGLTVTHTHGNRLVLDVNGKVSDIERAFHVTLRTYHHPVEPRDFFAPDANPSVPQGVAVLDITGLSDYAKPRSMAHVMPAAGLGDALGSSPGNGYIGRDFRNAYAPGSSLDGAGQEVGLLEFSGYNPNDIFAYEATAGIPNVHLQDVMIDGYNGLASVPAEAEVCLDIELAVAMAPNLAAVVVFESAATPTAWVDMLNTMTASNDVKQISSSWGLLAAQDYTLDQIFRQMAAQGQSFFQASGDGDAWTSPIWQPAGSTNVIVVGGTALTMSGFGAGYLSETVWNGGQEATPWGSNGATNYYWGSGGGVSASYSIPSWQAGLNMATNQGSGTMRNIPDVAAVANGIYVTHNIGVNEFFQGTSCAAPLWAGFMALVNEQAANLGNPPAGFINPAIYALGSSTNYHACFNDITTGNNTWSGSPNLYYAVPGYDLCTGWGTPAGTNLINYLAGGSPDTLTVAPRTGFVANGRAGGPFNGAGQTFTLNNLGSGALNWTIVNTSSWLVVSSPAGSLIAGGLTNIALSLAPAAYALADGIYTAAVIFSNDTTHAAGPRFFTLQVGQSLVQDGGFDSGTFSYWNLFGDTFVSGYIYDGVQPVTPNSNPVHSGNWGAFLGDNRLAILYQSLPTCPAQAYLLSFWLINPTNGPGEFFEVNWNTNGLAFTNTIFSLVGPPAFTWTNYNFVLTAAGTNTTLQFGAINPPNFFGLDDVSVTPIPVPSFVAAAVAGATNRLVFTWSALANVDYNVQYTTNLSQPNWLTLAAGLMASSNTLSFTDTNSLNAAPQRFYRISLSQ
jgi:hypothetical protein